jgi:hypothetical protein
VSFVGVHDPLFARALVLDNGRSRVVVVTVEMTTVPIPEELLKSVAEAAGVPASHVLLSATHDHEAPAVTNRTDPLTPVQQRQLVRIKAGAVAAAREAVEQLTPATISFGRGQAWVNVNNGEAAGLDTAYDPSGPSDRSVDVIRIQSTAGKPVALMVNYASHAEVMFRSVTKDGGYEVTGDIPGRTSQLLEASPNGAPVVLYTAAAEADQLPIFKSIQQPPGKPVAWDAGAGGWTLLDAQARRVVSAVEDVVTAMPAGAATTTMSAGATTVSCPGQRLHVDYASGKTTAEDRPAVSIPVSLVRINDIALIGIGGDTATEIGQMIKAASPAPHTTVVSMLAGSVGYIFPDSSYIRPGHGVAGSPLKSGCAVPAIMHGLTQLSGKQ